MSKFDTHGGYFAPKNYMRINEGGSHAENPNGGVQVGVDEQGIPNMLEEGEPVYKDYVYSDNIKASGRFLDANHIPVKYKDMLYSEIADDLFEEAEERPNDPVSRNGLEAMLGRLADAQEQQKQDSERRKLERELSKLSPEELEALQQELMAAQEQAKPQEQMPVPEQQVMPDEQTMDEPSVEQMPVEQQIPVMAGGGPLDKFDPFLKKKFPDNPSLTDVMVYRLVQEQIPGMPDYYPYDFKSRYKAQKALNENAASIKQASRMRKRKEAERNVMNWLDKFDNKYLGDKFIREYKIGPYRGEKTFSFFDNGGLLRTFDGGGHTGGGRSGARVELNMDNANLMTPGLLEWIVPGAKGAKAFKSAAEIGKYLISKYGHDAATLTTKVKDLEAAKVAAEKTLKEVKSMKTPYKSVEAAKKELCLIGQQLDKFKKGAKEAEELTAALNASQASASAAGAEVASNVGRASTANAADIVQKSKSVGKKVLTGALNVVDPGRVALSWWKPTSGAAKATKEVVGSTISLPVWGYGYLPAYNLGKDIIMNSGDIDDAEAFDDSLLAEKQDTTSTITPQNGLAYGGDINKFDGDTNRTGQMSRNHPYETGPVYSGTDFDDFLKWMRAYNGSRNAGNVSGTYAPDRKFNYGEYGNIKALEASEPYKAFTDSIINAITDKNADPVAKELAMRYLTAYNEALPESARGKIIDANGNLVDSWVDQYRKVRTYQPGVGHLSGNFAAMVEAAKNKAVAQKPQASTQPATAISQQPSGSLPTGIDIPDSPGEASDEVREWVERQLAGDANPEVQPVAPEQAGNNNVTQNTNQRAAGPYFPTFPRYAGAIGAGLLAAYDAFTPADRYTATRYTPYVPVGHINLQNQRYDPVDQNMIQNQMLAQGNSTQRALRNSGLGPSTGAAIIAADNNTTRNLGTGFLQTWQANNQLRNAVTAANNQAEGMRAQFDYGVDAARQRALNEAQIRNAQNDLMLQRLNYEAEGQKYNALSNQLNAGFNALAGIGRENFARNQANSNTTLEGYKALGAGIGAHLPYYDIPVIYSALGGYLKKIKK